MNPLDELLANLDPDHEPEDPFEEQPFEGDSFSEDDLRVRLLLPPGVNHLDDLRNPETEMTNDRRSQSRTRKKRQSHTVRVRGFLTQLRSQGLFADHPDVEDVLDTVVLSGEDDAMMDMWTWLQAQNDLSTGPKVVEAPQVLFQEPNPSQLKG